MLWLSVFLSLAEGAEFYKAGLKPVPPFKDSDFTTEKVRLSGSRAEKVNFVLQGTWYTMGITGRWSQVINLWDVPGGWAGPGRRLPGGRAASWWWPTRPSSPAARERTTRSASVCSRLTWPAWSRAAWSSWASQARRATARSSSCSSMAKAMARSTSRATRKATADC